MGQNLTPQRIASGGRLFGGFIGFVFGGIGVTVIASLWFGEMGDHAPFFFKVFGSLIASVFVAFGAAAIFGSLFARNIVDQTIERAQQLQASTGAPPASPVAGSYVCPSCGATLAKADVSPLGDVKCTFCGAWFNIHGRR